LQSGLCIPATVSIRVELKPEGDESQTNLRRQIRHEDRLSGARETQ
jgi:hypothetical protein